MGRQNLTMAIAMCLAWCSRRLQSKEENFRIEPSDVERPPFRLPRSSAKSYCLSEQADSGDFFSGDFRFERRCTRSDVASKHPCWTLLWAPVVKVSSHRERLKIETSAIVNLERVRLADMLE